VKWRKYRLSLIYLEKNIIEAIWRLGEMHRRRNSFFGGSESISGEKQASA
jgi:hypothetical protein